MVLNLHEYEAEVLGVEVIFVRPARLLVELDIDLGFWEHHVGKFALTRLGEPQEPGKARDALSKLLPIGSRVLVRSSKDPEGPWSVEVIRRTDGLNVNGHLLATGFVEPRYGFRRWQCR